MLDYIIFVHLYKTLILVVDRTYEFTNGITLPYITYWTYDRLMFAFAKSDAVI